MNYKNMISISTLEESNQLPRKSLQPTNRHRQNNIPTIGNIKREYCTEENKKGKYGIQSIFIHSLIHSLIHSYFLNIGTICSKRSKRRKNRRRRRKRKKSGERIEQQGSCTKQANKQIHEPKKGERKKSEEK